MSTSTKTLADLEREIRAEYDGLKQSARTTLTHAIRIGNLLVEAKKFVKKSWEAWLKENTGFSRATAGNYIKLASAAPGFTDEELEDLTVTGMLALIDGKETSTARSKAADPATSTPTGPAVIPTPTVRQKGIDPTAVRSAAERHKVTGDVFGFLAELGLHVAGTKQAA